MKKIILFLLLLFYCLDSFCQVVFNCDIMAGYKDFPVRSGNLWYIQKEGNDFIYQADSDYGVVKVYEKNSEIRYDILQKEISEFYGICGENIIYYTKLKLGNYGYGYIFNFQLNIESSFKFYNIFYSEGLGGSKRLYYQNSVCFTSWFGVGIYNKPYYKSFNFETGEVKDLPYGKMHNKYSRGPFADISADKMHLIDWNMGDYRILRLPNFEIVYQHQSTHSSEHVSISFLTNDMIIRTGPDFWKMYDINGKFINEIKVIAKGNKGDFDNIIFSHDLKKAIVSDYIIDTTPFRDWLDQQGLLWHNRAGTIKAPSVNVYQNANTEAKIFGTYASGAAVEVIDKSGGQDTFDGVADYWYKVRTAGGPEGWVFGGHLTLGEEIAVVKKPKVYDARAREISASSMLTEKFDRNMYQPVKAFDNRPDTGWMEAAGGPGIGEWIEIKFDKPITIDKLVISPGWFDSRYWKDNNRIRLLDIELDDFKSNMTFFDIMEPQEFAMPYQKKISRARFTVRQVFATKKDDDTCIAEIEFWNEGRKLEIDLSGFQDKLKVVPE